MRGECIKFISLSFSIVSFQKLYFELLIARFMRFDSCKSLLAILSLCKHSVNHVFSSPTSIINFTSKKPSYDDTRRSGRDNELLQRAQNDL